MSGGRLASVGHDSIFIAAVSPIYRPRNNEKRGGVLPPPPAGVARVRHDERAGFMLGIYAAGRIVLGIPEMERELTRGQLAGTPICGRETKRRLKPSASRKQRRTRKFHRV
jgi:hypothetical protein